MRQITTLRELQKEKKKLKLEMEVTKRAFAHSIGTSRTQVKSYILKNVVVPAGAVGLGYAGIRSFMTSKSEVNAQNVKHISSDLLTKLLPILISTAQAYFFKKEVKKETTELKQTVKATTQQVLSEV